MRNDFPNRQLSRLSIKFKAHHKVYEGISTNAGTLLTIASLNDATLSEIELLCVAGYALLGSGADGDVEVVLRAEALLCEKPGKL